MGKIIFRPLNVGTFQELETIEDILITRLKGTFKNVVTRAIFVIGLMKVDALIPGLTLNAILRAEAIFVNPDGTETSVQSFDDTLPQIVLDSGPQYVLANVAMLADLLEPGRYKFKMSVSNDNPDIVITADQFDVYYTLK